MTFLTDGTAVKFTGIDHTFNVYSTFVEFNIGSSVFSVKFYGLIIAFGFLLAVLFGGRMAYKWKMDLNKMLDVLLYGTIGGIIGARLYYVAFEWDYYSQNLSEIPKIWNGGLAIYGGLIGGIIAAAITCKVDKMDFLKLLDLAGMSFLIGQGIGRWGNYANQEAFGTNTTMPWGMTSSKVVDYIVSNQALFRAKGIEMSPNVPVHPTFLYESVWCLLGFFGNIYHLSQILQIQRAAHTLLRRYIRSGESGGRGSSHGQSLYRLVKSSCFTAFVNDYSCRLLCDTYGKACFAEKTSQAVFTRRGARGCRKIRNL